MQFHEAMIDEFENVMQTAIGYNLTKHPFNIILVCSYCFGTNFSNEMCCGCGASQDEAIQSPGMYRGKHIRLVE